jgi:hypothetical protein
MTPKVNRKLHLVIPVERGDVTVYVHSTPVGREQFDTFYLPIAKTFAAINGEGLGVLAGPRVAAKLLKSVSERLGIWESDEPQAFTVKTGLVAEIRRLTNILAPSDNGWVLTPLDDAVKANLLDEEDAAEVENIITFFTVNWLMHSKSVRESVMTSAAELWGGQLTSSSCTEYRASLQTSTTAGSSGENKAS